MAHWLMGVFHWALGHFSWSCLLFPSKIDIFIMTEPSSGRWVYFDTEITNSSGRVSYNIPKEKRLVVGVYPVKMVVR